LHLAGYVWPITSAIAIANTHNDASTSRKREAMRVSRM